MGPDPKPTRSSARAERSVQTGGALPLPQPSIRMAEQGTEAVPEGLARALMPFLLRDDGWLRIVPKDDGGAVYFKWKWTGGPHRNCYVMTVYPYHQAADALLRLAMKVDAVDSGVEAPVKDHYFQG